MAFLAYIDETGTISLTDDDQPVLWLVAVLVDEAQVQPLATSMFQLAFSALGWRPQGFEFHGSEIWQKQNHWAGETPAQLIAAYTQALALLEKHEIRVAYSSINKIKLRQKYTDPGSPYLLGLQFLCEKIHALWPNLLKVLVADESREHELSAVDMVADLQQWGTGIVPGKRISSIIDTLHFVRSEVSPGVQMADFVGYMLQRNKRSPEPHPDAQTARTNLLAMIQRATATWRLNGQVELADLGGPHRRPRAYRSCLSPIDGALVSRTNHSFKHPSLARISLRPRGPSSDRGTPMLQRFRQGARRGGQTPPIRDH